MSSRNVVNVILAKIMSSRNVVNGTIRVFFCHPF